MGRDTDRACGGIRIYGITSKTGGKTTRLFVRVDVIFMAKVK